MARSSDVLDLAVEDKQKKKSRKKLIVGIAMLGVIPVIGSTLAASISLGSGNIEFGQGSRTVVACDTNGITTTLQSTYSGAFKVATVTLADIDAACADKKFKVVIRDASGNAITNGTLEFTYKTAAAVTSASGLATPLPTPTTGTLILTPATLPASTDVSSITLETTS